jgi:hypothetical protein
MDLDLKDKFSKKEYSSIVLYSDNLYKIDSKIERWNYNFSELMCIVHSYYVLDRFEMVELVGKFCIKIYSTHNYKDMELIMLDLISVQKERNDKLRYFSYLLKYENFGFKNDNVLNELLKVRTNAGNSFVQGINIISFIIIIIYYFSSIWIAYRVEFIIFLSLFFLHLIFSYTYYQKLLNVYNKLIEFIILRIG